VWHNTFDLHLVPTEGHMADEEKWRGLCVRAVKEIKRVFAEIDAKKESPPRSR
jgi:hypothetical protein